MKYLIDTDIASFFLRGKHNLRDIFHSKGLDSIKLSVVTVAEMQVLAHKNPQSKVNLPLVSDMGRAFGVLSVDRTTWDLFSRMKADWQKRGQPRGDFDFLQGAVARCNGLVLVTHNIGHYEGIVECEDWTNI